MTFRRCLTVLLLIGIALLVSWMSADAGVAFSPWGNLYIWEPCQWPVGTSGRYEPYVATAVEDKVKDQDYTVFRFVDNTANDDLVGTCTLQNFRGLKYAGIPCVCTHGNEGYVAAVYRTTEVRIIEWIDGEANMEAVESGYWGWYARAKKEWASTNWKTILDFSNAIALILSCHGTGGTPSFAGTCGGRVGFGYPECPTYPHIRDDMNKLLGRMNGSLDGATKRKAGQAYDGGVGYNDNFAMVGNGDATLCPAPDDVEPEGSVGESGSGYILFDTYMDDRIPATDALEHTVLAGVCTIGNKQWEGDATGKFKITFDWTGSCFFSVKMKAVAAKCLNWIDGGTTGQHRLDGNRVTPTGDNKEWTFFHTGATMVVLSFFTATDCDRYIKLEWETATELNNAGFNVYRSTTIDAEKIRLNEDLITSKGNELKGAAYSYKDYDVASGADYYYWLEDLDLSGNGTMHGPVLASKNDAKTPTVFSLAQNYPNPFNPTVEIRYDLREDSRVRLEVYNVRGQLVATLVDDFQEAGTKVARWNGENERGIAVSAGVYFYRLKAGDFVDIKKMVLSK